MSHSYQDVEELKQPDFMNMEMIWVAEGLKPVGDIVKSHQDESFYDVAASIGLYVTSLDDEIDIYARDPIDLQRMQRASTDGDRRTDGLLNGYPPCCVDFFCDDLPELPRELVDQNERIRQYLADGYELPVHFRAYQHCDDCLTSYDSPTGRLEKQMGEVLERTAPQLYQAFALYKTGGHAVRTLPDGRNEYIVFKGTPEERRLADPDPQTISSDTSEVGEMI